MRIINISLYHAMILSALLLFTFACTNKKPLPDPLEAGWNNESVCELLHEDMKMRVLKCTFPPNVGHERHYHEAHYGYTISGSKFRIKDTTGVREVNVPAGSNFSNKGIVWHEVLNIGDSTGIFLIIEPK